MIADTSRSVWEARSEFGLWSDVVRWESLPKGQIVSLDRTYVLYLFHPTNANWPLHFTPAMRLFRTCFHRVRQLWSSHSTSNPALKWSQTILFWLPTGIVFTKYGYTMKLVTGRSMQVRQWQFAGKCPESIYSTPLSGSPRLIQMNRSGGTWLYSTDYRLALYIAMNGRMLWLLGTCINLAVHPIYPRLLLLDHLMRLDSCWWKGSSRYQVTS